MGNTWFSTTCILRQLRQFEEDCICCVFTYTEKYLETFISCKNNVLITKKTVNSEVHSEPCQTSKMKRFTISQNVRSYMFDRVLNKSLKLIYFYIMEPLMVKSFKILLKSLPFQWTKITGLWRILHRLLKINRFRDRGLFLYPLMVSR